jgi:hypothetical protein
MILCVSPLEQILKEIKFFVLITDKSHHGSLIDTFKEKDVTEVVGWPITNIVL